MNIRPQHIASALLRSRRVFLVGIRGVGMAALAGLLHDAGITVVGADVEESFVTDTVLRELGVTIQPLTAPVPNGVDVVIYSGAHGGSNNPLVRAAGAQGIPTLSLAQAVGVLSREKETLGVAGVGGKSSTTALLTWIWECARRRPSFAVGVGQVPNLGLSGRWVPDSTHFVVEADEYVADPSEDQTPRFLYLTLHDVVVTSLRYDHPDVYASFEDTQLVFGELLRQVATDGVIVLNGDDPALVALAASVAPGARVITVGMAAASEVQLAFSRAGSGMQVDLHFPGGETWSLTSALIGEHNARNIAYATTLARAKGIDQASIMEAVASFRTLPRRLEWRGETLRGAWCFDDYAHHPHEIRAICETLRAWFPERRLHLAFQPHTFSRTKALFTEFFTAMKNTQGTWWLLPIFASAREAYDPTITTDALVDALHQAGVNAHLVPTLPALAEKIASLQADDLVVTLGAGDIYHVYEEPVLHHPTNGTA